MDTNKLVGALLDYWAAKCEGYKNIVHPSNAPIEQCFVNGVVFSPFYFDNQADPIIEREHIEIVGIRKPLSFRARMPGGTWYVANGEFGANTAAMRCYVASKYGSTVPDELSHV